MGNNFDFYEKTIVNTIPRKKPQITSTFLKSTDKENHFVAKTKVKNKSVNIDIGLLMNLYKNNRE